jgi:hypothetical protein
MWKKKYFASKVKKIGKVKKDRVFLQGFLSESFRRADKNANIFVNFKLFIIKFDQIRFF